MRPMTDELLGDLYYSLNRHGFKINNPTGLTVSEIFGVAVPSPHNIFVVDTIKCLKNYNGIVIVMELQFQGYTLWRMGTYTFTGFKWEATHPNDYRKFKEVYA